MTEGPRSSGNHRPQAPGSPETPVEPAANTSDHRAEPRRPEKSTTVRWLRGDTLHAKVDGHDVFMDQHPPHGNDTGPSPKDLLLASVGGCTALDVLSILRKQRQEVRDLEVQVDGYLAAEHPKRFAQIVMTYTVRGTNLNPQGVARAVELSQDRYCGVAATLREPTEIETRIVLEETVDSEGADTTTGS